MSRFDCDGLPNLWDGVESVRDRLRAGGNLLCRLDLLKGRDATIPACTANADVLLVCCHRLLASGGKMPDIDNLRDAIQETYEKSNRIVESDKVCDGAWDLRKMLRFVKRKSSRKEVTCDIWMVLQHFFFLGGRTVVGFEDTAVLPLSYPSISKDSDFHDLLLAFNPDLEAIRGMVKLLKAVKIIWNIWDRKSVV